MAKSPLFGRRIQIAGSISENALVATTEEARLAREFVEQLAIELTRLGATFVLPVDAEKPRPADGIPVCFDWLIWRAINSNLARRPTGAPDPVAIAVQHHKSELQVPEEFESMWDDLRDSDRVHIENMSHWNMASKRLEAQAQWGDILIVIGGSEGVLYLANLYHAVGKPVVPLNLEITPIDTGARKLFQLGLSSIHATRLFHTQVQSPHTWVNRLNFSPRKTAGERVATLISTLEDLVPPTAFAVRLLNDTIPEFLDVDAFFDAIVKPVIEDELGYRLTVIDAKHHHAQPRIDEEIFAKLHRSRLVVADITGMRPNCFLELGYALGRGLPTVLTMKNGHTHPFDIGTYSAHHWQTTGTAEARRQAFRDHLQSVRVRAPLVSTEPLIP